MGPECSHCTSLGGTVGIWWDGEHWGAEELLGEEGTSRGTQAKPRGLESPGGRVSKALAAQFISLSQFLLKHGLLPLCGAGASRLPGTRADLPL